MREQQGGREHAVADKTLALGQTAWALKPRVDISCVTLDQTLDLSEPVLFVCSIKQLSFKVLVSVRDNGCKCLVNE